MIWHILSSISKLMAEVPYRLSFEKCLVAPTPLSDCRGDCPESQVNQESTVGQPYRSHTHLWVMLGQQPPSHQEGKSTPSMSQMGHCGFPESRRRQWGKPRKHSWPLAWVVFHSEHPFKCDRILPYSLFLVLFNVMLKAQASCSVTAWSDLPFSCG